MSSPPRPVLQFLLFSTPVHDCSLSLYVKTEQHNVHLENYTFYSHCCNPLKSMSGTVKKSIENCPHLLYNSVD